MFSPENLISSYSRKQAIEDGVLADLSAISEVIRKRWKYNMCCTERVWNVIEQALKEYPCMDINGIMHDISTMAHLAISTGKDIGDRGYFKVSIGHKMHSLQMVCGPGDTPQPVLTLMFMNES